MRVPASLLVAVLVGLLGVAVLPQESTPGFSERSSLDHVSSCTTPSGTVRSDEGSASVECPAHPVRGLDRWSPSLVLVLSALLGLAHVSVGRRTQVDLPDDGQGRSRGRVALLRGPPQAV